MRLSLSPKACLQNRDLGRRANQIAIYGGSGFRIATAFFIKNLQFSDTMLSGVLTKHKSTQNSRIISVFTRSGYILNFYYKPPQRQAFTGQVPVAQNSGVAKSLGIENDSEGCSVG